MARKTKRLRNTDAGGENAFCAAGLDVPYQTIEARKLHEIYELLWLPNSLGQEEMSARTLRALDLNEDLKSVGSSENMLWWAPIRLS